jgi:hypothetical protein
MLLVWVAFVIIALPSRSAPGRIITALEDCPISVTGDVNDNGIVSATDILVLFSYVYRYGPAPRPVPEAGDVTCNGTIDISDIITLVYYVFKGGATLCDACTVAPSVPGEHFYSFENDLQGWARKRTDIDLSADTIAWSIERSQDTAIDGSTSCRLFLNNLNDAGKIWIERVFAGAPNHIYHVTLDYALASADFGHVNTFRIIAGAFSQSPQTSSDLAPAFQGDTYNGIDSVSNVYVWLDKSYEFDVTTGSRGLLYVVAGVWGTWQTPRTYYIDRVTVTVSE